MIVMKFGGTSVGSPDRLATALGLVEERLDRDPAIVVSALAGVTNLLVEFCRAPVRGAIAAVVQRHLALARESGIPSSAFSEVLDQFEALADAHAAAGAPLPAPACDALLAFGERLSAAMFAGGLCARGIDARAVDAGAAGLVTDEQFGAAHPLPEAYERLAASLSPRPPVPIVTGFIGRTADGRTTTLGRGGSDYSAAILGASLGADEIQIWTDTSGMLSADPRIVTEARPVPLLSFAEASELAYFGAKVLHPKTLLPAIEREIPVRVLNTAAPGHPGSLITAEVDDFAPGWRVKSIACKKSVTAVTIASTRMLLAWGFLARVFEVFGRHRVVVDLVTTSEVSISVTVDDTTHLDAALAELEGIGVVEVRRGLAVVAVVGEGAPQKIGLAGHVFTLLAGVGVPIEMISQGASRVNLSFVVPEEHAERTVRLLHRGLGLDLEVAAATPV